MTLPYRIAQITPADRVAPSKINPNVMDAARHGLLTQVIEEFGALQFPLYKDDGEGGYVILDGHHRDKSFREASLASWHAVVLPAHASRLDTDRARLALNQLRGQPEHSATAEILRSLTAEAPDLDLSLTGLLPGELELLLRPTPPEMDMHVPIPSPEDEEEPAAKPTFLLELHFTSAKELRAARKILKQAAGKGGDHTAGFRAIAGMEKP